MASCGPQFPNDPPSANLDDVFCFDPSSIPAGFIHPFCQRYLSNASDSSPGSGCVNPPVGADFYPIFSVRFDGHGCRCHHGSKGAKRPLLLERTTKARQVACISSCHTGLRSPSGLIDCRGAALTYWGRPGRSGCFISVKRGHCARTVSQETCGPGGTRAHRITRSAARPGQGPREGGGMRGQLSFS